MGCELTNRVDAFNRVFVLYSQVIKRTVNGEITFFISQGYATNLLDLDSAAKVANSVKPVRPPYLVSLLFFSASFSRPRCLAEVDGFRIRNSICSMHPYRHQSKHQTW